MPIAPATSYDHPARRIDPTRLSDRAKRDEELRAPIQRVFEKNGRVCGGRKVWRPVRREGFDVARRTVARLHRLDDLNRRVRALERGAPGGPKDTDETA